MSGFTTSQEKDSFDADCTTFRCVYTALRAAVKLTAGLHALLNVDYFDFGSKLASED